MLFSILRSLAIEPVVLLSALAMNIYAMAHQLGIYRVICDRMFNSDVGSAYNNFSHFDCWRPEKNLFADPEESSTDNSTDTNDWRQSAEIDLQKQTSTFFMILSAANVLPCAAADVILGGYGDRNGRKRVIVIALFGLLLTVMPMPFLFAYPLSMPLYSVVILYVMAGCSGQMSSFMVSAAAYLADTVSDKDTLTARLSILQICLLIPTCVGPILSDWLLTELSFGMTSTISAAALLASLFLAMFLLKQVIPGQRSLEEPLAISIAVISSEKAPKSMEKVFPNKSDQMVEEPKSCCTTAVNDARDLLRDVWSTFTKRRQGHQRAFLWACTVVYFIYSSCEATISGSGTVFSLYVQKEPLSWDQDTISYYRSSVSAAKFLGLLVGIFVIKRLLRVSETAIVILGLLSLMGQSILIVIFPSTVMLFVSAAVGALAPMCQPCLQSFMARFVDGDEIGKTYAAFSLAGNFSYFVSTVGFGAVYNATVGWFAAFAFLFVGVLLSVALVIVLWMHIDYHDYSLKKIKISISMRHKSVSVDSTTPLSVQ